MKHLLTVVLVVLLSIGFALPAFSGMNHRPHSVKTFMGKDRKEIKRSIEDERKKDIPGKRDAVKAYVKGPKHLQIR